MPFVPQNAVSLGRAVPKVYILLTFSLCLEDINLKQLTQQSSYKSIKVSTLT